MVIFLFKNNQFMVKYTYIEREENTMNIKKRLPILLVFSFLICCTGCSTNSHENDNILDANTITGANSSQNQNENQSTNKDDSLLNELTDEDIKTAKDDIRNFLIDAGIDIGAITYDSKIENNNILIDMDFGEQNYNQLEDCKNYIRSLCIDKGLSKIQTYDVLRIKISDSWGKYTFISEDKTNFFVYNDKEAIGHFSMLDGYPSESPIWLLGREYQENPMRFENNYLNTYVNLLGTISDIYPNGNFLVNDFGGSIILVECHLDESFLTAQKNQLLEYNIGDEIEVSGVITNISPDIIGNGCTIDLNIDTIPQYSYIYTEPAG